MFSSQRELLDGRLSPRFFRCCHHGNFDRACSREGQPAESEEAQVRRAPGEAGAAECGFQGNGCWSSLDDRTKSLAYEDNCPDQANLKEECTVVSHNHTRSRAQ